MVMLPSLAGTEDIQQYGPEATHDEAEALRKAFEARLVVLQHAVGKDMKSLQLYATGVVNLQGLLD